jgi:hypothetical protein
MGRANVEVGEVDERFEVLHRFWGGWRSLETRWREGVCGFHKQMTLFSKDVRGNSNKIQDIVVWY